MFQGIFWLWPNQGRHLLEVHIVFMTAFITVRSKCQNITFKCHLFVDGNQGHFKWIWGPSCFSLCFFYNQLTWLLWRMTLNKKGWYQRLSCCEIQFITTSCYGVLQHCLPIYHVLVNMCTTQTSFISWTVWKAGQNLIIMSPSPVAVNQNVMLSINEPLNNNTNDDAITFSQVSLLS